MPDTPDFDKIAIHLCAVGPARLQESIAEQLRLIWNARGAADIAKIEHELATLMGGNASGPYINNLARALRGLDR